MAKYLLNAIDYIVSNVSLWWVHTCSLLFCKNKNTYLLVTYFMHHFFNTETVIASSFILYFLDKRYSAATHIWIFQEGGLTIIDEIWMCISHTGNVSFFTRQIALFFALLILWVSCLTEISLMFNKGFIWWCLMTNLLL